MTGFSTQGETLQWDFETGTLGTAAGSPFNIRTAGPITFPTTEKQTVDPEVRGFSHFGDQDNPIQFEGVRENAISVPLHLLASASEGTKPPVTIAFESAGCKVTSFVDTVAAGTHSTTTTEVGSTPATAVGQAFLTYDSVGGVWWPSYCTAISSDVLKWMYALPNAQVNGDKLLNMYSITPQSEAVTIAQGLTQYWQTRQPNSSNQIRYDAAGTVCGAVGNLDLKLYEVPSITPTFHVADLSKSDVALANESFRDTARRLVFGGGSTFVGLADATGATGAIARTNEVKLMSASMSFGVTTVPIPGTGGLNGIQGYVGQFNPKDAVLTIEMLMPPTLSGGAGGITSDTFIADWESATPVDKAIQIVQGTSGTATEPSDPCWGLFLPKAHLVAEPVHEVSEAYHKVTVKYRTKPSGFSATDFEEQNANWCLAQYTQDDS